MWPELSLGLGETAVRPPHNALAIEVGSEAFVQDVLQKLERRVKGRKVKDGIDHYELREARAAYNALFALENGLLSIENGFYWNELYMQSIG